MNIGNRIIYDQDGEIIFQTGELSGSVQPHKAIKSLHVVDLEFGQVNMKTHRVIKIDTATRRPVLEEIPSIKTPEQEQIEQLENELLLMAEQSAGGIL